MMRAKVIRNLCQVLGDRGVSQGAFGEIGVAGPANSQLGRQNFAFDNSLIRTTWPPPAAEDSLVSPRIIRSLPNFLATISDMIAPTIAIIYLPARAH